VAVAVAPGDTARAAVTLAPQVLALDQVVVSGVQVAYAAELPNGCYAVRGDSVADGLPAYVRLEAPAAASRRRAQARRRAARRAAAPAESAAAVPSPTVSGVAREAGGAVGGEWVLTGDTLVVRWHGAAPLTLGSAGTGWRGGGVSLTRANAPGGGCPAP
jgi:hypothetical protein